MQGTLSGQVAEWRSSKRWKRLRLRILARDNETCQECGALAQEVHHINPPMNAPTRACAYARMWTEEGLVALCVKCHRKADAEQGAA